MQQQGSSGHLVVVVGAGPAGIYATGKLIEQGHDVILFNRDLKPGGLAEYGIYFTKHKMKEGIRKQFRRILSDPRVHYFGHVRVGVKADLSLDDIRETLRPSALLITTGAQGTKFLGIPGEQAPGVYHAKDLVYHYNALPPFSQQRFLIGDRVAIIGIGNVMVDIAHYLVHVRKVKEVIAVARRGPGQRAYSDKEIKAVAANIDTEALRQELERIRPRLEAIGENVEQIYTELIKYVGTPPEEGPSPTRLLFRYLSAPKEILLGEDGRPRALRVEDTELVWRGSDVVAKGLGTFADIPCDTVIFAVGDRVDESLGLPVRGTEYVTNPHPDPFYPGDEAYQAYNPETEQVLEGIFVAGWSRKASDGLVGKAKQDGERGVEALCHYLERIAPGSATHLPDKLEALRQVLRQRNVRFVEYPDVARLEEIERREADRRGLEFFKFASDEEMFSALQAAVPVD
ncbi:MAG TPA: FAD-dependent oxidoreductase [Blastocatellia bacterium]|nr:FAD-dependent oxidoreductase [Blastocatellia bacterium]